MTDRPCGEGLTVGQLLELDACTQCGECLSHCPVQEVTGNPLISPPEKIRMFKEILKATGGLKARLFGAKADPKLLEDFVAPSASRRRCPARSGIPGTPTGNPGKSVSCPGSPRR